MKKRLFSILLIPCIVIILMPIMAFAETGQCSSCGDQLTVIYTKKDSLYHNVENFCNKCRVGILSGQEAHNLKDNLDTDGKGHWKTCRVCYGQVNYEVHKWSEFKTETSATCTEAGRENANARYATVEVIRQSQQQVTTSYIMRHRRQLAPLTVGMLMIPVISATTLLTVKFQRQDTDLVSGRQ